MITPVFAELKCRYVDLIRKQYFFSLVLFSFIQSGFQIKQVMVFLVFLD